MCQRRMVQLCRRQVPSLGSLISAMDVWEAKLVTAAKTGLNIPLKGQIHTKLYVYVPLSSYLNI